MSGNVARRSLPGWLVHWRCVGSERLDSGSGSGLARRHAIPGGAVTGMTDDLGKRQWSPVVLRTRAARARGARLRCQVSWRWRWLGKEGYLSVVV